MNTNNFISNYVFDLVQRLENQFKSIDLSSDYVPLKYSYGYSRENMFSETYTIYKLIMNVKTGQIFIKKLLPYPANLITSILTSKENDTFYSFYEIDPTKFNLIY